MALKEEHKETIRQRSAKPMIWVGIVSIVMLFAGLTSGYVVRQADGEWMYFEVPEVFYYSTAAILLSSATLFFASWAVKRNQLSNVKIGLGLTLLLGILFVYYQFEGYNALVEAGVYFTGPTANVAGSFFYIITGLHLAHLAGGMIAAVFTFIKALMEKYTAHDYLGIQVFSIYWHFLGILWVYLLIFLILVR